MFRTTTVGILVITACALTAEFQCDASSDQYALSLVPGDIDVYYNAASSTVDTAFSIGAGANSYLGKAPGILIRALDGLRSNGAGLDIVKVSQLTMTKMFDDLTTTYKNRTELLTGIQNTALKYRKVHSEATNVVASVGESASQIVKWLPTFKRLVSERKQAAALAVLKKVAAELEPVSARFQDYSKAHEDIHSEVEVHVMKATELAKSSEWKSKLGASTRYLPSGERMVFGENYKCEYVYPNGVPDGVTPDAMGECKTVANGSVATFAFLGMAVSTVAAPVAFMVGGPAGYLSMASLASTLTMIAGEEYSKHHASLQRDFNRLRRDLSLVHEKLVEQVNAFKEIQRRLERTSKSTDFMAEMAADPALAELLDDAIDETHERFVDVKKVCTQYIRDAVAPGAYSLKLLDKGVATR